MLFRAPASSTTAGLFWFWLRGGGAAGYRRLLDLAVCAVIALLLFLLLDFTLQTDLGRFNPGILAQCRLILRERLLERGDTILRRGRLRKDCDAD
jgi:hypothetical protein